VGHSSYEKIAKDGQALTNLLIMTVLWCCSVFVYYLIIFYLRFMPGDLYWNSSVSGLCILVLPIVACTVDMTGEIPLLLYAFIVSTIASIVLFFVPPASVLTFSIVLLFARAGNMVNFMLVYTVHPMFFPTYFLAESYGITNLASRAFAILAPLAVEFDDKRIPIVFMIAMCAICAALVFLLKEREKDIEKEEEVTTKSINEDF